MLHHAAITYSYYLAVIVQPANEKTSPLFTIEKTTIFCSLGIPIANRTLICTVKLKLSNKQQRNTVGTAEQSANKKNTTRHSSETNTESALKSKNFKTAIGNCITLSDGQGAEKCKSRRHMADVKFFGGTTWFSTNFQRRRRFHIIIGCVFFVILPALSRRRKRGFCRTAGVTHAAHHANESTDVQMCVVYTTLNRTREGIIKTEQQKMESIQLGLS